MADFGVDASMSRDCATCRRRMRCASSGLGAALDVVLGTLSSSVADALDDTEPEAEAGLGVSNMRDDAAPVSLLLSPSDDDDTDAPNDNVGGDVEEADGAVISVPSRERTDDATEEAREGRGE